MLKSGRTRSKGFGRTPWPSHLPMLPVGPKKTPMKQPSKSLKTSGNFLLIIMRSGHAPTRIQQTESVLSLP